jgi:hypothetical protein
VLSFHTSPRSRLQTGDAGMKLAFQKLQLQPKGRGAIAAPKGSTMPSAAPQKDANSKEK